MYEFFKEYALGFGGISENGCVVLSFEVLALVHAPKYEVSPSDNSWAFPFKTFFLIISA